MDFSQDYEIAIKRFLNYDVLSYKQLILTTILVPVLLGYYITTTIDSFVTGTAGFIMLIVVLSLIMIYSVSAKILRNRFIKIILVPNEKTDIIK